MFDLFSVENASFFIPPSSCSDGLKVAWPPRERRSRPEGARLAGRCPGLGPSNGLALLACERLFHSPPPPSSCPLLYPSSCFSQSPSSLVLHNIPVRITSCFASKRNCDSIGEKPCSNISSGCWRPVMISYGKHTAPLASPLPSESAPRGGCLSAPVGFPSALLLCGSPRRGMSVRIIELPVSVKPVNGCFHLGTDAVGYLLRSRESSPNVLSCLLRKI